MSFPIIPRPAQLEPGEHGVVVESGTPVFAAEAALHAIANTLADDLRADTGIALRVESGADTPAVPRITLTIADDGLDSVEPSAGLRADGRSTEDADERYGLEIDADGVRVWGRTAEAVFRGVTTFRQLVIAQLSGGRAELPGVRIIDGPRFAWRGLSFDVVRTFHGPDTVRRVIDMCALYKLNVLHLHLTDDQGWRVEVPSRPLLTEIGGQSAMNGRPGGYYRTEELAEIVNYAAERFITVVPEIDMPGHAAAAFLAYPELGELRSIGEGAADTALGALPPLSNLNPERPEVWAFVADVIDAVIPQFPQSAYLHFGGDEAFGMDGTEHAVFVKQVLELVRSRGRRAVGWQEIARATISEDDLVQYWMDPAESDSILGSEALRSFVPPEFMEILLEGAEKSSHDVPKALAQGAKLLISPTSRVYLDRPHAEASTDPAQEEQRARVGMPVYPAASLRDGVEWDPVDDTAGVEGDAQLAGVEGAVWCETVTDRDDLDFLLMPRLGGVGEKAWAARGTTHWDDYVRRLTPHSEAWNRRGWAWFRSSELEGVTPGSTGDAG